jgi:hypothetical protein
MAIKKSHGLWDVSQGPSSSPRLCSSRTRVPPEGWLHRTQNRPHSNESCKPDRAPQTKHLDGETPRIFNRPPRRATSIEAIEAVGSAEGESAAEELPLSGDHSCLTASPPRNHPDEPVPLQAWPEWPSAPASNILGTGQMTGNSPAGPSHRYRPRGQGGPPAESDSISTSTSTPSYPTPPLSSGRNTPATESHWLGILPPRPPGNAALDDRVPRMENDAGHSSESTSEEDQFWHWNRDKEKWVHLDDDGTLLECPDELD